MEAKCVRCGLYWGVSWMQKIPKSGYSCPRCDGKQKKPPETVRRHKRRKGNKSK